MLKPCANMSVLPGLRLGAMSRSYSAACAVSGISTMMTSAQAAASAGVLTVDPGRPGFLPRAARVGQPDAHLHAAVLQVQRVRVPLRSEPHHGHFLRPDRARDPRRRRRTLSSLVFSGGAEAPPHGCRPCAGRQLLRPSTKSGIVGRIGAMSRLVGRQPDGGRRAPSPPDRFWPSRARRTDAARRAGRRFFHGRR